MIAPSCRLRRRCQFYHSPRSLKREIQALGILALATLMLAVLLGIQVFRHTESVLVSEANRQLDRLGNKLAARYDYLRGSAPEATLWGSNKMLRALVQSTLADAEGVEGGFYRHRDKRLLGYAYPTYHGSGTKTDIPPTERPTIQEIIDQAIQQESVAVKQVVSGRASGRDLFPHRIQEFGSRAFRKLIQTPPEAARSCSRRTPCADILS